MITIKMDVNIGFAGMIETALSVSIHKSYLSQDQHWGGGGGGD